ncbi:MAG: alpha-N-arabinofuranosidase [Hyphomonadaceae bacterium]|nr:alpha-N-arabinofuranosidase [Hyphomonadaceae bacterium]
MKPHLLALAIAFGCLASPAEAQRIEATVTLRADPDSPTIDPNIYGQFVEHLGRGVYEGVWVGENSPIPNVRGIRSDVVAALRRIRTPLVRWPGGCFAELYHWRDGVGPRGERPLSVNTAWGDEPETNAFGTHEFMDFVEQIGAKPFLAINVASGSPGEAQAWLQYMTAAPDSSAGQARARDGRQAPYQVPFIGVGNENWGCGGNMTAAHYADVYRQYYAVLRTYGTLVVADANSDDYDWTETVLRRALYRHAKPTPHAYINRNPLIQMMSLHYYTLAGDDWADKGPGVGFTERHWALALQRAYRMDEIITRHSRIMDRFDPERHIALSVNEWGTWWQAADGRPSNLYQANTLRDGVIAGMTLNIFQNHAARVRMANIAQMVNVLQAMILTRGAEMIVTPTYHVFDLYQVHQGNRLAPVQVRSPNYGYEGVRVPAISASASRSADGAVFVSLVNIDPDKPARVVVRAPGQSISRATGRVMTADAMDARPDFGAPDPLAPIPLTDVAVKDGAVEVVLPAKSVAVVEIR